MAKSETYADDVVAQWNSEAASYRVGSAIIYAEYGLGPEGGCLECVVQSRLEGGLAQSLYSQGEPLDLLGGSLGSAGGGGAASAIIYFKGTKKPWTKGATPNSIYSQFDPITGSPKQTAIYDENGNVIAHVDWKQHGTAKPGHFHYFSTPGDPSTGHGTDKRHYSPFEPEDWGLPSNWDQFP